MNKPTTQTRLHLANQMTVEQDEATLFMTFESTAKTLVVRTPLSADDAWNLAQYVDMVDAGFGTKRSALYRCAIERLTVFVEFNLYRPQVRAMCGRAACLAALVAKLLDDSAEAFTAEPIFEALAA